jgi:aerobic carbon-monoxide dehydrogenase medium subunit
MKPVDFTLHQPSSLAAALDLLASVAAAGEDGKVLAGGQSLVPLLNFRLARPDHVIDIGRVPGLSSIDVGSAGLGGAGLGGAGLAVGALGVSVLAVGGLAVGALVRQAAAERSAAVTAACPLLAAALPHIAHPPIRARGTICGSLAHADPAAELPAVAVALDAVFVAVRAGDADGSGTDGGTDGGADGGADGAFGRREIAAAAFFQGYLTTALEPDELLASVYFPPVPAGTGAAFCEVARRAGDFALTGVAAQVTVADGIIADARICLSGVASTPFRSAAAEAVLRGQPTRPGAVLPEAVLPEAVLPEASLPEAVLREAAETVAGALDPPADLHATAEYRRHLARVLVTRAVTTACVRAGLAETATRGTRAGGL